MKVKSNPVYSIDTNQLWYLFCSLYELIFFLFKGTSAPFNFILNFYVKKWHMHVIVISFVENLIHIEDLKKKFNLKSNDGPCLFINIFYSDFLVQ